MSPLFCDIWSPSEFLEKELGLEPLGDSDGKDDT